MEVRFLKKTRPLRVLSVATLLGVMVVSFQNCAPQACGTGSGSSGSSSCSNESASTTTPTSNSNSQSPYQTGSGNLVIGGGGSSGSSGTANNGAITVGGGSSSGSGSSGSGSSSGGSSSSGSSSGGGLVIGGGGSSSGSSFAITKQPVGTSVYEKQDFNLEVIVSGGKAPYTYQWYKNGAPITNGLGTFAFYSDNADTWLKEGYYYVVAKDATGASVTSVQVNIGVIEPNTGCVAGTYFTYTNGTYDQAYNFFPTYFDGPRGKYIIHTSYDYLNFLSQYPSQTGWKGWSFPALAHLGRAQLDCRQNVPRINSAINGCYNYTGTITFECHNNKLKLISNTCAQSTYACDYGGGN